jgi:hypothetical protein
MSTEAGEDTTIAHLFNPEPAAAPAPVVATEQPLPPDVDSYTHLPPAQQQTVPAPQAEIQPEPQPQSHMVPLSELIAERRERQELARRAQQLEDSMRRLSQPQPQPVQQPQPVIDPVEDPQGFVHAITHQIEQRFLNQSLNDSERRARESHGSETVDAAFEAARQSGFAQAFIHKPDAYGEMVKWHKAQQLASQIGSDPATYAATLKEQIRAQVLAELKQGTPPPSNLPPSLSTATRANPQVSPDVVGSDKDFFRQTMNPKRG